MQLSDDRVTLNHLNMVTVRTHRMRLVRMSVHRSVGSQRFHHIHSEDLLYPEPGVCGWGGGGEGLVVQWPWVNTGS